GLQGAVEEASDAQIRELFAVNVFGVIDVIRAATPVLREQGRGHIVNVTSVGGRTSVALVALYSACKFAVEGHSMGLSMELAPFGIKVTTVAPGTFATNFAARVEAPANRIAAYDETHAAIEAMMQDKDFSDPAGCVELILKVADAPEPPRQIVAGGFAWSAVEQVMNAQMEELKA